MACGQMVMATYPPPTEAIFAGVPTMRERLARLARALFEHPGQGGARTWYGRIADRFAIVQRFVDEAAKHRIELTRAALAPFAIDRDLIRLAASLLDIGVCRALQAEGQSLDQAAETIADVIHARMTHKD